MPLTINDAGINVTISRETRSPSQRGFGTLLFLFPDAAVNPSTRVKAYTSFAGVAVDHIAGTAPYRAALAYYDQDPSPIDFKIGRYDPGEAIADELDLMVVKDSDFYCVCPDVSLRDTSAITDIADWVAANGRIQVNTSNDALCLDDTDTTNIMYLLKQAGADRTYTQYCSTVTQYPCASAFGVLATTNYSGRNTLKTLKFKDEPGITVENLDAAQLAAVKGFNGNVLYSVASIRMIDDGITGGGSWLDEIVGTDALTEELRVRVFGLLSRTKTKIPYTEKGMALIKAQVEGGLLQFRDNGFLGESVDDEGNIVSAYDISSTPVREASLINKSARISPTVSFTGRLAGAIHDTIINGTLVLE